MCDDSCTAVIRVVNATWVPDPCISSTAHACTAWGELRDAILHTQLSTRVLGLLSWSLPCCTSTAFHTQKNLVATCAVERRISACASTAARSRAS